MKLKQNQSKPEATIQIGKEYTKLWRILKKAF
jgi:hypothetical protein